MPGGRRRSPARLLAPLALLLAVAAVLIVVQSSGRLRRLERRHRAKNGHDGADHAPSRQRQRPVRATYTVKLNDTLGGISAKTGVPVDRLQTLNPELDPQNLIVGQKIKLRE